MAALMADACKLYHRIMKTRGKTLNLHFLSSYRAGYHVKLDLRLNANLQEDSLAISKALDTRQERCRDQELRENEVEN